MWKILPLMIASLAGACVMEEPLEAMSWAEAESESEAPADPEFGPEFGHRPPRDDCVADVRGCLASGLSREPGGQPGHSRCVDCNDICQRGQWWPDRTWYGGDCQWWNY